MPASPVHRLPLRVYAADTDASGVVHHAQYLVFAERARSEALRDWGLAVDTIGSTDRGFWVVRRATLAFRAPARLDELLTIESEVVAIRGASWDVTQRVVREAVLLCDIAFSLAWLDAAGRPRRQPPQWRERLAELGGTGTP